MSIYGKGIFIGGGGGGGGLSPGDAVIHVNAPNGSTINYSYGGIVVEIQSANDSHINAIDPTTSDYYYSINSNSYGAWIVTANLNGKTATYNVTISNNEQYDVKTVYRLYVYNYGDMINDLTNGYSAVSNGTFTNTENYMSFKSSSGGSQQTAASNWAVDLSNYTIMIAGGYTEANPTNPDLYRVGIGTTRGQYTRWARLTYNSSTAGISRLDFSDIDKSRPFYIQFSNASQNNPSIIEYIYFE